MVKEPTLINQILLWQHQNGEEVRSFLRVYIQNKVGLVIVSELRDNPENCSILRDFANLANTIMQAYPELAQSLEPDQITWLAHHGKHSTYDQVNGDEYSRVDVMWDGHAFKCEQACWQLLRPSEFKSLLGRFGLTKLDSITL